MIRLRLTFTKQGALRYIGHLDLAKTWERVLRRAGLPVAYSQGFHPQPKIQFASALPLGCSSTAEVMDVVFAGALGPDDALEAIIPQLPEGLRVLSIEDVPLNTPALQARLESADYTLTVQTTEPLEAIQKRVQALLDSSTLPRQRRGKPYDLRPLTLDLRVQEPPPLALPGRGARACPERSRRSEGHITLHARLRASQQSGTGRPDELLDALGLSEATVDICRVGLNFGD